MAFIGLMILFWWVSLCQCLESIEPHIEQTANSSSHLNVSSLLKGSHSGNNRRPHTFSRGVPTYGHRAIFPTKYPYSIQHHRNCELLSTSTLTVPLPHSLSHPCWWFTSCPTHKADADASAIFLHLHPFPKVRQQRKFKSTTTRITSFGQNLAPPAHYHRPSPDMRTLISPVLQHPLVLSGVDGKQQKANLYSFAHLVCCCLLSMVWDRLLASRRQTLVHAGLLGCCTKKYKDYEVPI